MRMEANCEKCLTNAKPHCHHIVERKQRLCRMTVADGEYYCGEHRLEHQDEIETNRPRVQCPYDPKHTCYAHRLRHHLANCNSKPPDQLPPYCVRNINAGCNSDEGIHSEEPLSEERINNIYATYCSDLGDVQQLTHSAVTDALADPSNGQSARKHLLQSASLIAHVEQNFPSHTDYVVEFGSGRGQLAYWLSQVLPSCRFLLVDKSSPRHKYDSRVREEREIERVRVDIKDLKLSGIARGTVVSIGKHLCGGATDLTLRCMQNAANDGDVRTGTIAIALCCHHRCDWDSYVGKAFFKEVGLDRAQFEEMSSYTSWATCGEGRKSSKAVDTELGLKCKRIIDHGRLHFMQNELKLSNVKLVKYVSETVTPENVLMLGFP